jgi:hypothetical protein
MSAGVCRCRVAGILHTMDRYRALVEAEVDTFVAQRTRPNRDGVVRASDLFAAYVEWSNTLSTSPVPPMTNSMFGRVASLGRYGFSDIRRIPSEDEQPDRLQMDDHHIDGMPGNQTAILITSHRSQKGGGPTRRSEGT